MWVEGFFFLFSGLKYEIVCFFSDLDQEELVDLTCWKKQTKPRQSSEEPTISKEGTRTHLLCETAAGAAVLLFSDA